MAEFSCVPAKKRQRKEDRCIFCLYDQGSLHELQECTIHDISYTLALAHTINANAHFERCLLLLTTQQQDYKMLYHTKCYTSVKNQAMNILSEQQGQDGDECTVVTGDTFEDKQYRSVLRTKLIPYDLKKHCLFCLKEYVYVHRIKVRTLFRSHTTQDKIHEAAHKLKDSVLLGRISSIPDFFAYEVRYHKECYRLLTNALRHCSDEVIPDAQSITSDYVELSSSICRVVVVDVIYNNKSLPLDVLLGEHSIEERKRLQHVLMKKFSSQIKVIKNFDRCQSGSVCRSDIDFKDVFQTLVQLNENVFNEQLLTSRPQVVDKLSMADFNITATALCTMFRSIKGLHSDDVIDPIARDIPHELLQFMCIMVFGSDAVHENLTGKQKRKLLTVIQIIVNIQSEGKRLMPMCHLFGSSVLQLTNSNTAIGILNRCGITTSYTTERRLEKEAAIALKHVAEREEVYIPPEIFGSTYCTLSVDNWDWCGRSYYGAGSTHVTTVQWYGYGGKHNSNIAPSIPPCASKKEMASTLDLDCLYSKNSYKIPNKKHRANIHEHCNEQYSIAAKHNCDTSISSYAFAKLRFRHRVPDFTAFHSTVLDIDLQHEQTKIGYSPVFPDKITDDNVCLHIMETALKALQSAELKQSTIPIFCDNGVYPKLRQVKAEFPEKFQAVTVMIGSFHFMMAYMGSIGKLFGNLGYSEILLESKIFGNGDTSSTVKAALAGKAWELSRISLRRMQSALIVIQLQEFESQLGADEKQSFEHLADVGLELSMAIESQSVDACQLWEEYLHKHEDYMKRLSIWRLLRRQINDNFRLWDDFIIYVDNLNMLEIADRTGCFVKHLEAFTNAMPLLAAMDHTNFTRSGAIYLTDMQSLRKRESELWTMMTSGCYGVKRTKNKFSTVPPDLCHEQCINCDLKSRGSGVIGLTYNRSALMCHNLSAPWKAVNKQYLLKYCNLDSNDSPSRHRQFGAHYRERGLQEVSQLLATIKEKFMNPFSANAPNRLTHLVTKEVADSKTRDAYLNAYDVGNVSFMSCLQRLTVTTINPDTTDSNHANIRTIYDTIKRNNLKLTFSYQKKKIPKNKTEVAKVGSYQALMSAMNDSERNPEDLVNFEVCDPPETMFDVSGNMRKADKAVLLKSLRAIVPSSKDFERENISSACVMFDMMGVVQLLFPGMPKGNTYLDFYAECKKYVSMHSQLISTLCIAIDSYEAQLLKLSVKVSEQRRRNQNTSVRICLLDGNQTLPIMKKEYLGNVENKEELTAFLFNSFMRDPPPGKRIFLAGGNLKMTLLINPDGVVQQMEECDHIEADTKLAFLWKLAACKHTYIYANDTDIPVIFISALNFAPGFEIWYCQLSAVDEPVGLHLINQKLTAIVSGALPALHVLTGCDQTSYPAGAYISGKLAQLRLLLNNSDLARDLESFGNAGPLMTENDRTIGLRFLLTIYTGKYYLEDPVDAIYNKIRWQLITTCYGKRKPNPSISVAECHVSRAVWAVHQYRKATLAKLDLPNPSEAIGWHLDLTPITGGSVLQAPGKRKACTCKTRCIRSSCKCVKNKTKCGIKCECFLQGCMSIVSTVPTVMPETQQENIYDLSADDDDDSDIAIADDSSDGENLYHLDVNGDNITDDDILLTDIEDLVDIDFDDGY